MTTLRSGSAKLPLRVAMEARDLDAVVATFAPDAVFRSPLTSRITFEGCDQITLLSSVVLKAFPDLRYTEEVHVGDTAFLVWESHAGGKEIQGVDYLKFDSEGLIKEFTVFFRPLPATTAALRIIGSGIAGHKSRVRSAMVAILSRPMGFMADIGDRVGVRLLRSAL